MNSIYLYGASGHAKVIIDILKSMGIGVLGLFDDNPDIKFMMNYSVVGIFSQNILKNNSLIISIGNNISRKKIISSLPSSIKYAIAIDSSAFISDSAKVNCGTVVMQGSIIQSSTQVGKHCIINTLASVDHDCVIEDYVHISPNSCICGGVFIGEGTQIGAGSVIVPNIKIGKWCIVGAGSVVLRDIPDNTQYINSRITNENIVPNLMSFDTNL